MISLYVFEDLFSGADPEFSVGGGADPRGWRGEITYDFPENIHENEKTLFGRRGWGVRQAEKLNEIEKI